MQYKLLVCVVTCLWTLCSVIRVWIEIGIALMAEIRFGFEIEIEIAYCSDIE